VVVAPRTLVALVAVSLGGLLLLALAYAARRILVQLVVAIVLAMALDPFVQVLERRGLCRGSAVGVAFTLALLGLALFVYLLVPPLVDEVTRLHFLIPSLENHISSADEIAAHQEIAAAITDGEDRRAARVMRDHLRATHRILADVFTVPRRVARG